MKRFFTKRIFILALALIMCFSALTAFVGCNKKDPGEGDVDYITKKGELVIGITYFEPMNYMKDGELVGFETEFAKAVCEILGVTAKFQEINWETKEIELEGKAIDCIWNGLTITDERQENMSISKAYMKNKQVLVMKSDKLDKYTDAASFKGAKIVAEAESSGEEVAKTNDLFKSASYTAVGSMKDAVLEVFAGTADICIIDYITSLGMLGEGSQYKDLVVDKDFSFADEQYGIALRRGSDMTAKINDAISKLIANGKLDEIAAKYNLSEQIIKN